MSTAHTSSKSDASLFWLLAAFFGFAFVFYALQWIGGRDEAVDPRMETRLAIKEDILAKQHELLAKAGLGSEEARMKLWGTSAKKLAAQKASKSGMLVPGSPTQLQQAEAPAPAPVVTPPAGDAAPAAPVPAAN